MAVNENQTHSVDQLRTNRKGRQPSISQKIGTAVSSFIESIFYRLGVIIGTYPKLSVLFSIIGVGLFSIGMLSFHQETDGTKLWVSKDAEILTETKWVMKNYPSNTRSANMIVAEDNILAPSSLQKLLKAYQKTFNLTSSEDYNLTYVCQKIKGKCMIQSILELWLYDENVINNLTQNKIMQTINSVTVSPVTFKKIDVTTLLGGIKHNDSKHTISARAATIIWIIQGGKQMKPASANWETVFIDTFSKNPLGFAENYILSSRSFSDEAGAAILGDTRFLIFGYVLMILYVSLVLGRFNMLEQKFPLALAGIVCIGLGVGFSFGFSSAIKMPYGPLHTILPFLLLGIGVDDMFVIMGAFSSLLSSERELPVPEQIGRILKQAGVSITVTSLSDIVAFAVGAITILPALQSFCVFASFGILGIFILEITFFGGFVTLDYKRSLAQRNACCCCYKHENYIPNKCSQYEILQLFFNNVYIPFLQKLPVKIIVVLMTLGLAGLNIYEVIHLKQDFDEILFFPVDSNIFKHQLASRKYFPQIDITSRIYCKDFDYFNKKKELSELHEKIELNKYVYNGSTQNWHKSFLEWLKQSTNHSKWLSTDNYPKNKTIFYILVKEFLNQPTGYEFGRTVKLTSSFPPEIKSSYMTIQFVRLKDSMVKVKAMKSVRETVHNVFSKKECFVYARQFIGWETNAAIQDELYRNILVAFSCVFVVTLLLIANLWTCILVGICIMLCLVGVGGGMRLWGLTIDTISFINLVIAVGLTVDYCVHIGHTFMTIEGTRNERSKKTLSKMGPAVFNGGFSTFLAFFPQVLSISYVFTTFFKIFFLVVVYGLYHGLVFLPVVLSFVGPLPYLSIKDSDDTSEQTVATEEKNRGDTINLEQ